MVNVFCRVLSFLLLLALFVPAAAGAGMFSDTLSFGARPEVDARRLERVVFKQHFGVTSPTRYVRHAVGRLNADSIMASPRWQGYKRDMQRFFDRAPLPQHFASHEYVLRRGIKERNMAATRSLNVKGSLGEMMMDAFYKKEGWEVINGKRGSIGIDGLYVKRRNGVIVDFLVADAKTGNARLGMTKRGLQLSPEWVEHQFKELRRTELAKPHPNPALVSDFETLAKLHRTGGGRTPRVFQMKIERQNGRVCCAVTHLKVRGEDGKSEVLSKPKPIDMQKDGRAQRAFYKNLKQQLEFCKVTRADAIVGKIEAQFKAGLIGSDSDLHHRLTKLIPDRVLAKQVTQSMGAPPAKAEALVARGKGAVRALGLKGNALALAGQLAAVKLSGGRLTAAQWMMLGKDALLGVGADASSYLLSQAAHSLAESNPVQKALASQASKSASRTVLAKAAPSSLAKFGSAMGKSAGFLVGGAFAAYELYGLGAAFSQGTVSRSTMLKQGGGIVLASGGSIIATCAISGLVGGPVGVAVGVGTGVVVAVAVNLGCSSWVQSGEMQKLKENAARTAAAKTEDMKRRREDAIIRLQENARWKSMQGWSMLLPES